MSMDVQAILAEGEAATTGGSLVGTLVTLLPIVLVIVLMYFIILRPQKKREKEEQKMRNNMRVGDEITTIGGICGRVVTIRETGADRNKMTIKKWAVQSCDTVHDPKEDDDDDDDDDDI